MSSSIHYKLKAGPGISTAASSTWSSIHFDGVHLSLLALKQRIIYKEGWWRSEADAQFDLHIVNSNSGEEYKDDDYNVHRNVSVIVKRVPAQSVSHARRLYLAPDSLGPDWNKSTGPAWAAGGAAGGDANHTPLGGARGGEDSDIAALISQRGHLTGAHQRPSGPFQQTYTARTLTRDSKPPPGYKCHRCKKDGHYIQFCPTNSDPAYDQHNRAATTRAERELERQSEKSRIQNSRSYGERDYSHHRHVAPSAGDEAPSEAKGSQWLKPVEDPKAIEGGSGERPLENLAAEPPKQRMFSSAFFAGNAATLPHSLVPLAPPPNPHTAAAAAAAAASAAASTAASSMPTPLRADLTCQICKDYFVDAHVLGCCYTSFCRDCIQDKFKATGACPACGSSDVTLEDDLSENKNLQKAVEQFLIDNPTVERGAIKRQIAEAAEAAALGTAQVLEAAPAPAVAAAAPVYVPQQQQQYTNGSQQQQQYGASTSGPRQSGGGGGGGGFKRGCFVCGSLGHAAKYCPTTGGPGGPGDPEWHGHAHNKRPPQQQQVQPQINFGGGGFGGYGQPPPPMPMGGFAGFMPPPQMPGMMPGMMPPGGMMRPPMMMPPMGGMPPMGMMPQAPYGMPPLQQFQQPQQPQQPYGGGGGGGLLPTPAGPGMVPDSHKRYGGELDEEQQNKRRRGEA